MPLGIPSRKGISTLRLSAVAISMLAIAMLVAGQRDAAAASKFPLLAETFQGASATNSHWVVAGATGTVNGSPANGLPCLTASTNTSKTPIPGCAAHQPALAAHGDPVGSGALRLTDNHTYETALVVDNRAWRFNTGLSVDFDFYMYGNGSPAAPAADGLSFFLLDGSVSIAKPGANGGALGYAPIGTIPGLAGGYLGIGFDEFGNFEQTLTDGGGCSAPQDLSLPDPHVAARGPGDGTNGYCLMAGSGALPGRLDAPNATLRSAHGVLRHAHVDIDAPSSANPKVTVLCDFGSGPTQVLRTALPANPPSTFTLGFAAGNGIFDSIHEVSNLTVDTVGSPPVLELRTTQAQLTFPIVPGLVALAVLLGAAGLRLRWFRRRR